MNRPKANAREWITYVAWSLFALIHASLLLGMGILPSCLQFPLLAIGMLALLYLLIHYCRPLAQWRFVILSWCAYSLLRVASVWLHASGIPFLQENMATFTMLLAVEAMLAGWFATLALVIMRDVSLAYLVIFFALGGPLLRRAVMDAGSVLSFLFGPGSVDPLTSFSITEPLTMSMSCMATLGFVAFLPHFVWLAIKEFRG